MQKIITFLRNWKTTLAGVIPLAIAVLVAVGVIDVDGQEVANAVDGTLESAISTLEALVAVIGGAVGLIGLFAKDGDKSTEEVETPAQIEASLERVAARQAR